MTIEDISAEELSLIVWEKARFLEEPQLPAPTSDTTRRYLNTPLDRYELPWEMWLDYPFAEVNAAMYNFWGEVCRQIDDTTIFATHEEVTPGMTTFILRISNCKASDVPICTFRLRPVSDKTAITVNIPGWGAATVYGLSYAQRRFIRDIRRSGRESLLWRRKAAATYLTLFVASLDIDYSIVSEHLMHQPAVPEPVRPKTRESLRRLHAPLLRREIVARFRADLLAGKVANREAWAKTNYGITAKTLKKYMDEFPE